MGKSNICYSFIFYQKRHCKVCLDSVMIDIVIETFKYNGDYELYIFVSTHFY